MWAIDVHLDPAGLYRWRLWAADGRTACSSPVGFPARFNAQRQAKQFSEAARDLQYVIDADGSGSFVWRAVDSDGKPLASSAQTFECPRSADEAADRVRRYAGLARGV